MLKLTVSNSAGADGSTVAVTFLVRHDDNFLVVGDHAVLKDLGRLAAANAAGRSV